MTLKCQAMGFFSLVKDSVMPQKLLLINYIFEYINLTEKIVKILSEMKLHEKHFKTAVASDKNPNFSHVDALF